MIARRPKPTNSPITSEDDHGRLCPPHWSARIRQQRAPRKTIVPRKSRCLALALRLNERSSLSVPFSRKNARRRTNTGPPIGRLLCEISVSQSPSRVLETVYIQKHHLQLRLSVKAPPMTGPMHTETPNTLITMPMNNGLRSNSTAYPMMAKAPCSTPAAPRPATARPTINVGEFGAAAQMMDPTGRT